MQNYVIHYVISYIPFLNYNYYKSLILICNIYKTVKYVYVYAQMLGSLYNKHMEI